MALPDSVTVVPLRVIAYRMAELADVHRVSTLDHAVGLARTKARAGDIVLLSPAGTSFDAYANFESRGDAYRRAVGALVGFREALRR